MQYCNHSLIAYLCAIVVVAAAALVAAVVLAVNGLILSPAEAFVCSLFPISQGMFVLAISNFKTPTNG